jgi:hypothetical protein
MDVYRGKSVVYRAKRKHKNVLNNTKENFPTSLGVSVRILLQEKEVETNDALRRINQLVHAQQMREHVFNKSQLHQDKMKRIFDRHTKKDDFKVNDLVLMGCWHGCWITERGGESVIV